MILRRHSCHDLTTMVDLSGLVTGFGRGAVEGQSYWLAAFVDDKAVAQNAGMRQGLDDPCSPIQAFDVQILGLIQSRTAREAFHHEPCVVASTVR